MATQKIAAKTVAKKVAAAPAPAPVAAKKVAAKVAAPTPVEVAEQAVEQVEEQQLQVGGWIEFKGYADDVPQEERFLVAGTQYQVVAFSESDEESGDPGGDPIVSIDNPSFDAAVAEDADSNPPTLEVGVLPDEYDVVSFEDDPAETAEEVAEEAAQVAEVAEEVAEVAAEVAEVAAKAVAKPVGKKVVKQAPTVAAKSTGKKVAGKTAAVKKAKPTEEEKAAAAAAKAEAKAQAAIEKAAAKEAAETLPDLENEDPDVLAIVDAGDLISAAQNLEADAATSEYRLGGVLFHIKKDKAYLNIEGLDDETKAAYAGNKGFEAFLTDYFNIGYRSAMYFIEIYIAFTQAKIPDPAATVARIGWAKAQKISKHLIAENSKPEELIELAAGSTSEDLSVTLKEQYTVGGTNTGGEKVERVTLKYRYIAGDGKFIREAIETVRSAQGLKGDDDALLFIVRQYVEDHAPTVKAAVAPKQGVPVGKPGGIAAAKKAVAAPATAAPTVRRVAAKAA